MKGAFDRTSSVPLTAAQQSGACIFVRVIILGAFGASDYPLSIAAPPGATIRDVALASAERFNAETGGSGGLIPLLPDLVTDMSGTMLAPSEPVRAALTRLSLLNGSGGGGDGITAPFAPLLITLRSTGNIAPVPGSLRAESVPLMASLAAAANEKAKSKGVKSSSATGPNTATTKVRALSNDAIISRVSPAGSPWAAAAFTASASARASAGALIVAERNVAFVSEAAGRERTEVGLTAALAPALRDGAALLVGVGPCASLATVDAVVSGMWPFVRVASYFPELETDTGVARLRKTVHTNFEPLVDIFRHYCLAASADVVLAAETAAPPTPAQLKRGEAAAPPTFGPPKNTGAGGMPLGMSINVSRERSAVGVYYIYNCNCLYLQLYICGLCWFS